MTAVSTEALYELSNEVALEIVERGSGSPMLVLHGAGGPQGDAPFLDLLAEQHRVIAPSHAGFGRSTLPRWLDTVDDLVHMYLELVDDMGLTDVTLVGFSLGGWIAAELAVLRPTWLSKLVLVDAVGIRVGDRDQRDLADIWAIGADELAELVFHDAELGRRYVGVEDKTEEQLQLIARNQEAAVLFGWEPYMHNRKLRRRLSRINVPTLLVWGASDGLAPLEYGRAYAESIPGSELAVIEAAGHLPQIERPDEFAAVVRRFSARPSQS
jgi:pimeloyl-ACP methyl ester carboxylesterase